MTKNRFGKDIIVHWSDRKRWCGLPLSFTRYYIVEKPDKWIKLFCEKGFLHSHIEEVHLYKIDDFTMYQSLTNKIFNVGNLEVYHNDSSDKSLYITRVKDVYRPYSLLTELVERDKARRKLKYSEFQRQ